jgi:hypothetical protein
LPEVKERYDNRRGEDTDQILPDIAETYSVVEAVA